MNKSNIESTERRITVLDYITNKSLKYDHVYLHSKPEENLVSLYVGGFGDEFRTIYRITGKHADLNSGMLTIWVRKF